MPEMCCLLWQLGKIQYCYMQQSTMVFYQLTVIWVWLTAVKSSVCNISAWHHGREWDLCEIAVSEQTSPNCFCSLYKPPTSSAPTIIFEAQFISVLKGPAERSESYFQFLRCILMYPLPVETTCTFLPGLSTATHYQLGILGERFLKKILEVSQKYIINVIKGVVPIGRPILK